MPILCQIARPEHRATGYGLMNLVSITVGAVATVALGWMRDCGIKFSVAFNLSAAVAALSAGLILLVKPPASLQLGGHGGVSGGANLFPKLYVQVVEACRAGNLVRAQALQAQIQRVSDAFYRIGKYSSAIIKGIKCALACLGICDDFMAEPFHRFRAEERELVKLRLKEIEGELSKLNL